MRKKQSLKRKRKVEEDSDDGIVEEKIRRPEKSENKLYMEEIGYQTEALSRKERRKLKKKNSSENESKVTKSISLNKTKTVNISSRNKNKIKPKT